MSKTTETTLEIDLSALEANYNYITSKLSHNTQLMAVVKAYSYGSDSVVIAKKLETLGVRYFAVAYAGEGVLLRNQGITASILVLHPLESHFKSIVENRLEPNLYSPHLVKTFLNFAEENLLEAYKIHIKINSGMNRVGLSVHELDETLHAIKNAKAVQLVSVFSHLAASEDVSKRSFAEKQLDIFVNASQQIISILGYRPLMHTLNTSGILNFPEAHFDLVRSGIGLYGYGNTPEEDAKLIPVATLKTVISQIHHIEKGDFVGYNFGFQSEKPMITATLPLGHADGISRAYGKGKGFVYINGQKAPTVGNICMDMFMVDVTHIPCKEYDEVLVFGKGASAENFAQAIHSISYEIITSISQRVKRVVLE